MDYRLVIRIIEIKDHRSWQEFVAQELQEHRNLQMNAVSANGLETVQKPERLQPDWRRPVRVDPVTYDRKLHIGRKLKQTGLWDTSRFREPLWWALTMAFAISIGFLLVRLMQ